MEYGVIYLVQLLYLSCGKISAVFMGPHCCSVLHVMNFLALVSCILLYAMNQAEIPSWSEAM